MQRLEFIVEGSKGDEYHLAFELEDGKLNAFCSCPAGASGTYCKHRFALMDGDISALLSNNKNDVSSLKIMMAGTPVERLYKAVVETQAEYDQVGERLKKLKRQLAKAMQQQR